MHFTYSEVWDKGDYYAINQDSYAIQAVLTGNGPYAMAIVCDGVGSLARGEYAGGVVAGVMTEWFYEQGLPFMCRSISRQKLRRSCIRALGDVHRQLEEEGQKEGVTMGTTFSMLILAPRIFYYFHVGDCECYRIGRRIKKISQSHKGKDGELLSVIGVGRMPQIIMQNGYYSKKDRFLICSDGLNRCLTMQGLKALGKDVKGTKTDKSKLLKEIVLRGRRRGERDNCTGILIGRCK